MNSRGIVVLTIATAFAVVALLLRARLNDGRVASSSNVNLAIASTRPTQLNPKWNPSATNDTEARFYAHIAQVERDIQTAYFDRLKANPEADLYLALIDKAGTPPDCRWRAYLALHDLCENLAEFDFDIQSLKQQATEASDAARNSPNPKQLELAADAKREAKIRSDFRDVFIQHASKVLRRFNPDFTDRDLETLLRFRPGQSHVSFPQISTNELYHGY